MFDLDHLRCFACSRRYYSNVPRCSRCGGTLIAECSVVWEAKTTNHSALEDAAPGRVLGIVPEIQLYREREGLTKKANGGKAGWRRSAIGWFGSKPASKKRRELAAEISGDGEEEDGGDDAAEESEPGF